MIHLLKAEGEVTVSGMGCDRIFLYNVSCVHMPRQERVKAGVLEKLILVELSMKMLQCR